MEEGKKVVERFGGARGIALLIFGFAVASSFYHWRTAGSGDAIGEVGAELGLQVSRNSQRWQLDGQIDDIGIRVKTTPENLAGETRWYTDFALYAPGQPRGRIVGASLRQRVIGDLQGADRMTTGDADFDRTVFVEGDPAEMLAHLDAEARATVHAATEAGWELEGMTWTARESGRMTSARRIRSLLDAGLAAVRAMRMEDNTSESPQDRVENDPSPGVRMAASALVEDDESALPVGESDLSESVTEANALEALVEVDTPRSLEAALLLARAGEDRQEVRNRLVAAVFSNDRMDEVIEVLGKVGGRVELAVLGSVKGEHEEAAKAAIAAIEKRL